MRGFEWHTKNSEQGCKGNQRKLPEISNPSQQRVPAPNRAFIIPILTTKSVSTPTSRQHFYTDIETFHYLHTKILADSEKWFSVIHMYITMQFSL